MAQFAQEYCDLHVAVPSQTPTPLREPSGSTLFKKLSSIASLEFKKLLSFGNKVSEGLLTGAQSSPISSTGTDCTDEDGSEHNTCDTKQILKTTDAPNDERSIIASQTPKQQYGAQRFKNTVDMFELANRIQLVNELVDQKQCGAPGSSPVREESSIKVLQKAEMSTSGPTHTQCSRLSGNEQASPTVTRGHGRVFSLKKISRKAKYKLLACLRKTWDVSASHPEAKGEGPTLTNHNHRSLDSNDGNQSQSLEPKRLGLASGLRC